MPRRKKKSSRRLVNPRTASMVPISLRVGHSGHIVYPGYEALNDVTPRIMDVRQSWMDAFQTHFGLTLDPSRFFMQRAPKRKETGKVLPPLNPHGLEAEIRELIMEFQKMRNPFVVYVMDRHRSINNPICRNNVSGGSGSSMNISGGSGSSDDESVDEEEESPRPPVLLPVSTTTERPPLVIPPRSNSDKSSASTVRVHVNAGPPGRVFDGRVNNAGPSNSRFLHQPSPAVAGPSSAAGYGHIRQAMNKSTAGNIRTTNTVFGTKRRATSQPSVSPPQQPHHQRPKFSANYSPPTAHGGQHSRNGVPQPPPSNSTNGSNGSRPRPIRRVVVENGDDDDDAGSVGSGASQDSQIEDLVQLGIDYEDVKASFCKKAKKNITNTQFLKAKTELQDLKRKYPARWCKWTTYAPTTANIIRDLFDV